MSVAGDVVTKDVGALPQRRELHAICDAAQLDDRDAVPLNARLNTIYHLPREGLVLHLANNTRGPTPSCPGCSPG